jgi:Matrixin
VELLGSSRVDVDNIFAALIAHEIGHNLGLEHEYSPAGLMFAYEGASTMERRTWLQSASAGRLRFKPWQLERIRLQAL